MRTYFFEDETDDNEHLLVKIPEKVDPAYGMYVWPCAVVLAQYMWYNRQSLVKDKHVLELGAGTSLPGVVAAMCGSAASVTLTDDAYQPKSIKNCELSCAANSIQPLLINGDYDETQYGKQKKTPTAVKIAGLHWGEVPALLFTNDCICTANRVHYPDIILASDCFFDESVFEKILFTVRHLFEGRLARSTPSGQQPRFLCTYQVRSAKSSLDDLLQLWDLKCRNIPLATFSADTDNIAKSKMPGNHKILMLEITLNR